MGKLEQSKKLLLERNVKIEDIANLVYDMQKDYTPSLTMDKINDSINSVLSKREVYNTILTGVELDKLAEKNLLSKELNDILLNDYPLYGIDEILALSITNLYGSIAFSNFGYLDRLKPSIIAKLNEKHNGVCNTFLDDIVCAIIAGACSKLAHNK